MELIGRDSLRYYKDLLFAKQLIGEESAQDEDLAETCTPRGAQRGKAVEASSPPTRMEDDRSDEEDLAAFVAQSKKITKEDRGAATPTAVIPGDMDLQHNQVATTTIALEERKTIGLE